MNNHPGYPSADFPSYGRRHQNSFKVPAYGSQWLPNHDTQEFSRNERLSPYQNAFRQEMSSGFNALSSLEDRQSFSNEEMNSYRSGSRQYRLSREDIFSAGRLTQIDRRTLLQSAPRTSFLNESSSNFYSHVNRVDSQARSVSSVNQNPATSKFKSDLYSNVSRNEFSKEDVPYDNLQSSGLPSDMQMFGQDSYQNEQMYSESPSNFNNTSANLIYSKNTPFNNRTFSEDHSLDTGFSRNKLSSGMSYLEVNYKHKDMDKQMEEVQRDLENQKKLRNDERVEEIHRLLREQKDLSENDKRLLLSTGIIPMNVPANVESDILDNVQSISNSFSRQVLPNQMNWYERTMDIKEQPKTPNKSEMFYPESSHSSENAFHGDFSLYSLPSTNKSHHNDILNYSDSWNNSLESQNRCETPEKMAIIQDSSQKLSPFLSERRSNDIITVSAIAGTMPVTSVGNSVTLKVDEKVNIDEEFVTKENISEISQNCSNENIFPINQLSENCNVETNATLVEESLNKKSLEKNLGLSASFLTIPPENLPFKDEADFKSSNVLVNKSIESKSYSAIFDKSFSTNELHNSDSLHYENNSNEPDESSRHSMLSDEKITSTKWSTSGPITLEDNLNKCLEIMKNYSPILVKNDRLKSGSLSVESNSNECFEAAKTILRNSGGNISSNESSNSAPIPFLNEAIDSQSLANISVNSTDNLLQESESSKTPSFNSAITNSREMSKTGSALEDALATLHINSPVVGLDYIVEEKNSLSIDGRFPFKCKLCNSSIARTLILDHIQGSKHRLRYLKIKDEGTYENIMRQKDQHNKDILICEAAAQMEQKYGRGRVVVLFDTSLKVVKKVPVMNICKVSHDLIDVDFESTHKPDVMNLEVDSVVKQKPQEKVSSILPEPVIKMEDDSYSSSVPKQNFDNEKKGFEIVPSGELENVIDAEDITNNVKSDIKSEFSVHTQMQTNQLASSPFKRAFLLGDDEYKNTKKPHIENLNMDCNTSTDFQSQDKSEPPSSKHMTSTQSAESNIFNPLILEKLSKCEISSEDEAKVILQTVDILLKLLLRFKLKDMNNIDVENLMLSLHDKSPEEMYRILGCLKGYVCEDSSINEGIPKDLSKYDSNTHSEISNELKQVSDDVAVKRHQTGSSNLSQNNSLVTNTKTLKSSKQVVETSEPGLTGPVKNTSSSQLLQPPPFFCWPTTSNVATAISQSSVATSQTAQNNMTWSSAYQPHMAYYQQQGFNIPHMYQPYGVPMVPSIPSASVPLAAQIPPMAPPTIMAPLPPGSVDVSPPPPPPPPPPLPPSELPPLPK